MKLTLYVGHNVGNTPDALSDSLIIEQTAKILGIEAFTAIEARGIWQGQTEKTTVIIVCGITQAQANEINAKIPNLASALKQNAIYRSIVDANDEEIAAAQQMGENQDGCQQNVL